MVPGKWRVQAAVRPQPEPLAWQAATATSSTETSFPCPTACTDKHPTTGKCYAGDSPKDGMCYCFEPSVKYPFKYCPPTPSSSPTPPPTPKIYAVTGFDMSPLYKFKVGDPNQGDDVHAALDHQHICLNHAGRQKAYK